MKSTFDTQNRVECVKASFKKMMSDKKAVSSYVRERGTLDGFKDSTIQFAKPL